MTALNIVAIGDSLTQGFVHGAAGRPRWSYPAILARALGVDDAGHRVPEDEGPGFPVDVSKLLSYVEARAGAELRGSKWLLQLPYHVNRYIDLVEDFYERGPGQRPRAAQGTYHNLACFGFTVNEALTLSPSVAQMMIEAEEGSVKDDLFGMPSGSMYRNAQLVLNPSAAPEHEQCTMIDCLRRLADSEPIDMLLVWLGNNDALQTVLHMELAEMPENFEGTEALQRIGMRLTSQAQFERDYERLVKQLDEILAGATGRRQVYLGTVPHVTIPPVTTGLGEMVDGYFEAYGRFYRNPGSSGGTVLTRAQVRHIDQRIDCFNATIRARAKERGWTVIDTVGIIDRLAVKRNGYLMAPGRALRDDLAARGYTSHPLLELDPVPSLLGYQVARTDNGPARAGGGIFGLDYVHPSTVGYALIAEHFLDMIKLNNPHDQDIQQAQVDWESVLAVDELFSAPPGLWHDISSQLERGAWLWDRLVKLLG